MKKIFIFSSILALILIACDKVENAYPESTSGLDPSFFPGNFADYTSPTFSANPNTNRNVLIEDFTGHTCTFCPIAADIAHGLEIANPDRVFVSTIHTGPDGPGGFQALNPPTFTHDFTNDISTEIGIFFGNYPNNLFQANPSGNVSRIPSTNLSISTAANAWEGKTNTLLADNDLKVNIQSVVNYFEETKGAYIHVEVENLQSVSNELRLVVAFYEDSIVKPQEEFGVGVVMDYVHRDLLKAHINGGMNGQIIDEASLNEAGNHYFEMSYRVPDAYSADNCHLLIYVFDKETQEIYQVIKKKFI